MSPLHDSASAPAADGIASAPASGRLAGELLDAMASIRRSARVVAERPAELAALTSAQIDLVRLVRRRPGIAVGEAAAELRLAANTVSTLVRQLTATGLVIRTVDAADRRVAQLDLAPEMRERVGAFRDRRVALVAAAMDRLPAPERRRLAGAVELLGRLAADLPDRKAPGA